MGLCEGRSYRISPAVVVSSSASIVFILTWAFSCPLLRSLRPTRPLTALPSAGSLFYDFGISDQISLISIGGTHRHPTATDRYLGTWHIDPKCFCLVSLKASVPYELIPPRRQKSCKRRKRERMQRLNQTILAKQDAANYREVPSLFSVES